jgi:anti-sigma regulatory factor (Ser/Thr protein kinase)
MTQPVFDHIGLLHGTSESYARTCVSFIGEGLTSGAPVLVAVPGDAHTDLIRDALGQDARQVHFADMAVAGRNPGRVIPWVLLEFADRHPGRRVWLISQPMWPARSDIEYPACVTHDALINTAFAGRDAAILCPYDTVGLSPQAITDAHRTHPRLADGTTTWDSIDYGDPIGTAKQFDHPLPPPPVDAYRHAVSTKEDLRSLREAVTSQAESAGLLEHRVRQLVIAVNELASNSLEHGGGTGVLSLWAEPGMLVCQIDDAGVFADPMAGRRPRPPGSHGGYGLLIVHELADLVRIHNHAQGTSIRLHIHLPG